MGWLAHCRTKGSKWTSPPRDRCSSHPLLHLSLSVLEKTLRRYGGGSESPAARCSATPGVGIDAGEWCAGVHPFLLSVTVPHSHFVSCMQLIMPPWSGVLYPRCPRMLRKQRPGVPDARQHLRHVHLVRVGMFAIVPCVPKNLTSSRSSLSGHGPTSALPCSHLSFFYVQYLMLLLNFCITNFLLPMLSSLILYLQYLMLLLNFWFH